MKTQSIYKYVLHEECLVISSKNHTDYSGNILRDSPASQNVMLERYFNDLYGVFLKKITHVALGHDVPELEHKRLKMMLDELLKVRRMLEKGNTD